MGSVYSGKNNIFHVTFVVVRLNVILKLRERPWQVRPTILQSALPNQLGLGFNYSASILLVLQRKDIPSSVEQINEIVFTTGHLKGSL